MSEWIKRLAAKYAEVNESKFLIPEEIPTAERTAFMGAAAAAHKAGQTHFNFGGKKHKVTMKTDTAKAIADDVKEAKVDEISMSKMQAYGKAAAKDIEQKRNKVKAALDQPASPKKAQAGLDAMKGLTKRSKGSDMYVDKMTGRSKVKPTAESDEVVMNPKKEKKEKASQSDIMAQESYSVMNEGSYERAAYGKGDAYDRSEAHEEAARDHEMAAEKHEKARNFTTADLHTAAAKAHQKAADNFSRIHAKREKSRAGGILNTTKSRDAHAASLKAHSYNESTIPPVYARILESRDAHYKKASKPEDWDEKEKNNKGAMDMKADHKGETIDNPEAGDQMAKATNAAPSAKARSGDNKAGDKKIIPSATPMKGM